MNFLLTYKNMVNITLQDIVLGIYVITASTIIVLGIHNHTGIDFSTQLLRTMSTLVLVLFIYILGGTKNKESIYSIPVGIFGILVILFLTTVIIDPKRDSYIQYNNTVHFQEELVFISLFETTHIRSLTLNGAQNYTIDTPDKTTRISILATFEIFKNSNGMRLAKENSDQDIITRTKKNISMMPLQRYLLKKMLTITFRIQKHSQLISQIRHLQFLVLR